MTDSIKPTKINCFLIKSMLMVEELNIQVAYSEVLLAIKQLKMGRVQDRIYFKMNFTKMVQIF